MTLQRSTVIPAALAMYLAAMAYIGYDGYAAGTTSPAYYFGIIGTTIVILIMLHFNLKRRERLRRERLEEIKRNESKNK